MALLPGRVPDRHRRHLTYRDTDHITTEYAANLWATLGRALRMIPDNGVEAPTNPDEAIAGGSE